MTGPNGPARPITTTELYPDHTAAMMRGALESLVVVGIVAPADEFGPGEATVHLREPGIDAAAVAATLRALADYVEAREFTDTSPVEWDGSRDGAAS